MSYFINKIFWALINPLNWGVFLVLCGYICGRKRMSYAVRTIVGAGLIILYLVSSPAVAYVLGWYIEKDYVERGPGDVPCGDIAIELGGGWRRAWFAAEILKAGKVNVLVASGAGVAKKDEKLMLDLGVAPEKIIVDDEARNTEENIKNAKRICEKLRKGRERQKILVVTSAVHMPRSMLMMKKYWPEAEAIAAPCEFGALNKNANGLTLKSFIPNHASVGFALSYLHEYLGYIAYRWVK